MGRICTPPVTRFSKLPRGVLELFDFTTSRLSSREIPAFSTTLARLPSLRLSMTRNTSTRDWDAASGPNKAPGSASCVLMGLL